MINKLEKRIALEHESKILTIMGNTLYDIRKIYRRRFLDDTYGMPLLTAVETMAYGSISLDEIRQSVDDIVDVFERYNYTTAITHKVLNKLQTIVADVAEAKYEDVSSLVMAYIDYDKEWVELDDILQRMTKIQRRDEQMVKYLTKQIVWANRKRWRAVRKCNRLSEI